MLNSMNAQLYDIYQDWKSSIPPEKNLYHALSAPLLLNVTSDYIVAKKKVLVIGQETFGWEWTSELQARFPDYPEPLPYGEVFTLHDFVFGNDSVEALMWGYREFGFAKRQPKTHSSPFWRAFRHITNVANVAGMWTNLSRSDFNGKSILKAPKEIRNFIASAQRKLLNAEIKILQPDFCIFFSGPIYDEFMNEVLGEVKFVNFPGNSIRTLAMLESESLPSRSIRTYHPGYLSRVKQWSLLDQIKNEIEQI